MAAFQLVSVENQGRAVVWTVLDTQRDFNTQLGLAHWGQVNQLVIVIVVIMMMMILSGLCLTLKGISILNLDLPIGAR